MAPSKERLFLNSNQIYPRARIRDLRNSQGSRAIALAFPNVTHFGGFLYTLQEIVDASPAFCPSLLILTSVTMSLDWLFRSESWAVSLAASLTHLYIYMDYFIQGVDSIRSMSTSSHAMRLTHVVLDTNNTPANIDDVAELFLGLETLERLLICIPTLFPDVQLAMQGSLAAFARQRNEPRIWLHTTPLLHRVPTNFDASLWTAGSQLFVEP